MRKGREQRQSCGQSWDSARQDDDFIPGDRKSIHPILLIPWCLRLLSGRGVPLGMTTLHLECPDADSSDWLVPADVFLRQEPDEDEDEDKRKKEDDDDEETEDGYSE